jgi:hypothetical protein
MIDYKEMYKESHMRSLYVVAMKSYGSLNKLCIDVGIKRQYVTQCRKKGIPLDYAGYLGRKFNISPAVFCYETSLMMSTKVISYNDILKGESYFTLEEKKYILAGAHIRDAKSWIKLKDESVRL